MFGLNIPHRKGHSDLVAALDLFQIRWRTPVKRNVSGTRTKVITGRHTACTTMYVKCYIPIKWNIDHSERGYNPETPSNFPHHSSVMLIE